MVLYANLVNETHVSEPGLVVVDVAVANDATALAFQQMLAGRWATATAERTTRDPGQPGVRLRCYLDLRRNSPPAAETATARLRPPFLAAAPLGLAVFLVGDPPVDEGQLPCRLLCDDAPCEAQRVQTRERLLDTAHLLLRSLVSQLAPEFEQAL
ncbi:DUF6207 family protein [Streptomyces sp. CSDS2]|uniref:DUF6207 family protein n=1 Tax=Streptomyces sp. CSDS2 TaxID=3055051 RepID=UPI00339D539D